MGENQEKKKRTKLWITIGVIAAILVCCGGAYLYFSAQAAKTYGVQLVVNAKGLDTKKGTKIPIHAAGKDSKGKDVDSMFYGGTSSSDIMLKPGKYSLEIEASPIAEDGTIYDTKDAVTKVSIAKDGKTDVEKEITITPIPAEEVTDEQIEAAYSAAKDSGIDKDKLKELKEKAKKQRDDAVAARKAEEERKAEEARKAEEERKAEEARKAEEERKAEEARKAQEGVIQYTGTIRLFDSDEALCAFQGISNPNPGSYSMKYVVLAFDQPTQVTARNGDGRGERVSESKMLLLDSAGPGEEIAERWNEYKDKHVTVQFSKIGWFPSDTGLPLGEPRFKDVADIFED